MELIFATPSPTTELLLQATRCGARKWVNEFRHSGSIPHQHLQLGIFDHTPMYPDVPGAGIAWRGDAVNRFAVQ